MAKKRKPKEKPLAKTKKKFKTILSLDMGVKNCAFSVLKGKKIIKLGFVEKTISNLIDPYYNNDIDLFVKEFTGLLDTYKPNAVAAERFQNRGMFRGNGSELINIMIGIISRICHERKIYCFLLTAAQWKNQLNRQFKQYERVTVVKGKKKKQTALDRMYEELKPFPNHLIDSHLQGVYLSNLWADNPYEKWQRKPLEKYAKLWLKENSDGCKARKRKR